MSNLKPDQLPPSHRFLVTAIGLAFLAYPGIQSALAAERMAMLTNVSVPKTTESRPPTRLHVCGDWVVWTELELASSPASHVLDYRVKVFRSRIGSTKREEMLDIQRARFAVPFVTMDGVVGVVTRYKIWTSTGKDTKEYEFRPYPYHVEIPLGEPVITGIRGNGKRGLFCVTAQGELKQVVSNLGPTGIRKQRDKLMWVRGGGRIVVLDLQTGKLQVVGKGLTHGKRPTVDGLYGNWVFCHQGNLAQFINTENGRELQMKVPGNITHLCPDGILFAIDNYHHRFWDPVLQRTRDLMAKTHASTPFSPGGGELRTKFFSTRIPGEEGTRIYVLDPLWLRRPGRGHRVGTKTSGQESKEGLHNTGCWYFNTKSPVCEIPLALLKDQIAVAAALKKAYESGQRPEDVFGSGVWNTFHRVRWPYAPETLPALRTILRTDSDRNLRRRAALRVGRSNDQLATEILLEALTEEEHWYVLEGILEALTLLCDKNLAGPILEKSYKPRGLIESTANALGVLGDPAALPYLNSVSDATFPQKSQQEQVRTAVSDAIRYITMRSEVEELLTSLRQTSDK